MVRGPLRPRPPPPQHKVVPLLCFVHIFIEKPSSEVVPLIIFADPSRPLSGPFFFTFLFLHPSLSTKFGQKVNHEIILEITGVIDSSQGYLKTYKLIKAFFYLASI